MQTVYIVETNPDDAEGFAVFEHEDQAKEYAGLRGLMYSDAVLCDRGTGERMIKEARRDD